VTAGVLVVDKPRGITSFDAVQAVGRILKERKCGHAGTLDPMATGVLPVCVGAATKIAGYLTEEEKEYEAGFAFGVATDTGDATGKTVEERPGATATESAVTEALAALVGTFEQVPPAYSAVKVGGVRSYTLARKGMEVPLAARRVTVREARLLSIGPDRFRAFLAVSKGFYVRSLPRDLGERRLLSYLDRTHEKPAEGVHRRARNRRADTDVDRDRLAREHRLVDRRLAFDDHAIRRDLLSGSHHEEIAHREVGDRYGDLHTVAQHTRLLRAELEERTNGRPRPTPGASLESTPEQDQRRDHGGDLEVDVGVVDDEQRCNRPPPRSEGADRDERVHRGRAVARVEHGGPMEVESSPEDDRRREAEGKPFPPFELQRHDHREHDERRGQDGRDEEPPPEPLGPVCPLLRLGRGYGVIAGRLDCADELGDGHASRIEAHCGLLGRVVHRRLHALELVELALDPVRARRAGHSLEGEVDVRIALRCRGRGHVAS